MLNKQITRQHFENAAEQYDATAVLQCEVAKRLCERLDYIKLIPQASLDVGCGTGFITKDLLKRYPKSNIIAIDLAFNMLKKSKKLGSWLRKPKTICADAEQLPLKADSADLIVSNLMLHWCDDLAKTFSGFHHTLAPNGLLLFTAFGPDTLTEIRQSRSSAEDHSAMNPFIDMHEIGDALLQSGFIDPVMDMEMITMTYANMQQLMKDVKNIGFTIFSDDEIDEKKREAFEQAYEPFKTEDGLYPVTWEIIYGHAWVGEGLKLDNYEKVIPIQPVS